MALPLRPIDNALPNPPERPKKQAKVAAPIQKQSELSLNDENKAPLPASADATTDYIFSENLKPIPDPDTKIESLIEGGLDSKDWNKVCESLNNVRRFALYHVTHLAPFLEKVLLVLVKVMKSPRSALIKTSIMTSSDIFKAFGDNLIDSSTSNVLDQLLLQLLLKASQDKKFVCEEAEKALNAMVEFFTPLPLLKKLQVYVSHSNPRIRAKAAISISNCVAKTGLEGIKEYGMVSLLQMAAELLNDRLPEAREAARSVLVSLFKAFTENEEQKQEAWQSFCQSNLAIHAQSIAKITTSL